MKALTLHQPWASLIAVGAKRIETRSWSTRYRGRILIHAGAKSPRRMATRPEGMMGDWWVVDEDGEPMLFDHRLGHGTMVDLYPLPLGAVVASAVLADCVPIITHPDGDAPTAGFVYADPDFVQYHPDPDGPPALYSETERSFGDYSDGRWAWLLDDVKPTTARCPRCWGGAIRCTGYHGTDAEPAPCYGRIECGTCGDTQACEPVPMRGRQGLWTVRDHDWKAAA
jgi:hypothetical protein